MRRFSLAFIVLLLIGVLVVGTMSVLADKGGPFHGADHGVATGLQDDGNGDDAVVAQQEGEEEAVGAQMIAQAIADAFSTEAAPVEAAGVMALHDRGIGFGALFKLYAIAQARGTTVGALLEEIGFTADGEHAFAFGQMMNKLTEAQLVALEEGPRNLGQLVSAADKPGPAAEGVAHAFGRGHGQGKPQGVPPAAGVE